MSGIVGSKLNHRGSGLINSVGTDGQHMLSSGKGKSNTFETVTAGVSVADMVGARQDTLTLALKLAIAENAAKYNLPNSAICKFEADADFDLDGSTTISRNASEYITPTGTDSEWITTDQRGVYTVSQDLGITEGNSPGAVGLQGYVDGYPADRGWGGEFFYSPASQAVTGKYMKFSMGEGESNTFTGARTYKNSGYGQSGTWTWQGSNDDATWTDLDTDFAFGGTPTGPYTATWANATAYRYIRMYGTSGNTVGAWQTECEFRLGSDTLDATGTALGTTNVPTSAVTEVSGVMLIKHAYGANELGTDVTVYFTADNSNWTEADSYTDAGTFSTGIKMIKLGSTTVTSGSDVRWKIVFANQAFESKQALIYGIALNY